MSIVEKKLEEKQVFHGFVFDVYQGKVQLPDGREAGRDRIGHSGGAGILPLDEEGNIYLVRQYRYGVDRVLLEIPAGKLEPGEDPMKTAARELTEEVGFLPGQILDLGELVLSPAYLGEITYIFLGRQLTPLKNELDADEFLEVVKMPFREAYDMVLRGEIADVKTQVALLKTAVILEKETH